MPVEKSLNAGGARAMLLGAMSLCALAGTSASASAQFFGGLFGRPMSYGEDAVLPPRAVAGILYDRGYRLSSYPARRGNRIVALGTDGRGQVRRFVLDAYEGDILGAAPVGGIPSYGRAYAYRTPGGVEEPRVAPALRAKPKVKTAARPPVLLPQAAPASAAPRPSQAARPPATVTPASPVPVEAAKPLADPVVTTPPASAAAVTPPAPVVVVPPTVAPVVLTPAAVTPQVSPPVTPASTPPVVSATPSSTSVPTLPARPAPDAQPRDIGPKIVPVKPIEARAPDAWDTEAEPAKPAPDAAPGLAAPVLPVERHAE